MVILIDFVENFSWGCFFAGGLPTPHVYSAFGNLYVFRSSHVSWRCFQTENDWRSVMVKLRQLMHQELLAEKRLHPSHNSDSTLWLGRVWCDAAELCFSHRYLETWKLVTGKERILCKPFHCFNSDIKNWNNGQDCIRKNNNNSNNKK